MNGAENGRCFWERVFEAEASRLQPGYRVQPGVFEPRAKPGRRDDIRTPVALPDMPEPMPPNHFTSKDGVGDRVLIPVATYRGQPGNSIPGRRRRGARIGPITSSAFISARAEATKPTNGRLDTTAVAGFERRSWAVLW